MHLKRKPRHEKSPFLSRLFRLPYFCQRKAADMLCPAFPQVGESEKNAPVGKFIAELIEKRILIEKMIRRTTIMKHNIINKISTRVSMWLLVIATLAIFSTN